METGRVGRDILEVQGRLICGDVGIEAVGSETQSLQEEPFFGQEVQMGALLTRIAVEKLMEERLAAVIALGHPDEGEMDGVAGRLQAFDLLNPRADKLLQGSVFDAFLPVREFGILPSRQFLIFGEMQTVAVEEFRLVEQGVEFGIVVQRVP